MPQSIPGKPVFPALPRLSSRGWTHTTVARGTALWESLVGKPHPKASRESHRSLKPREEKRETAATARDESSRACPHSRRGLTPLGRLQGYPKIHESTGEECSGSNTYTTQDLRPRHRRERNPERPTSNSHGDWPFLRPRERVPEVPVVSREHLPQPEKIQEVLPSRRDEAHFSSGFSRLITPNLWNFQRVLHTLAATQEVPNIPVSTREEARESRPHPEESRFRLLAREEGSFPCVLRKEYLAFPSNLKRRRSPEERREELQGRATIPRVPQMSQSIPGKPVFPALPRLSSQGSTHTTGHVGQPCGKARGKASWESFEGKPQIP